jgi:hypothetical protein
MVLPMKTRLLGVLTATLSAMIMTAPAAPAAHQFVTVGNVAKPAAACNNHGTMVAGGWLANKACGYVMGTAIAGTRFDVSVTTGANFHFGRWRAGDGSSFCAWLVPGALNTSHSTTVADTCGSGTSDTLKHRLSFGHDFDVKPHTGNGEIIVKVNPSACAGFYNYFVDSDYRSGRLHDPVGVALPSTAGYRYSTRDNGASMIRADINGETTWMFVARDCIAAQLPPKLNNDND